MKSSESYEYALTSELRCREEDGMLSMVLASRLVISLGQKC